MEVVPLFTAEEELRPAEELRLTDEALREEEPLLTAEDELRPAEELRLTDEALREDERLTDDDALRAAEEDVRAADERRRINTPRTNAKNKSGQLDCPTNKQRMNDL